jgi:hypothetical protein
MFGAFWYPGHDKYYKLLCDPVLWAAKVEESTAFKWIVTLIEKFLGISFLALALPIIMVLNFYADYSQPVIMPFTVAVPNVNYPPVLHLYDYLLSDTPNTGRVLQYSL